MIGLRRTPCASATGRCQEPTHGVLLWLHRCHGDRPSELQPLRAPRAQAGASTRCAAEAFVEAAQKCADGIDGARQGFGGCQHRGVPCRIGVLQPLQLRLEVSDGESLDHVLASLFMAEVSCAPLPTAVGQRFLVLAFILPFGGAGLQGTVVGGHDMTGSQGWFVLLQSEKGQNPSDVLDFLGQCGCLRGDLLAAYLPAEGDSFLGAGAYATVWRLRGRDGSDAAVKMIKPFVELRNIDREVAILIDVHRHEHVVAFLGVFWRLADEDDEAWAAEVEASCGARGRALIAMCFDVAPYGNLLEMVRVYNPIGEIEARCLFEGVFRGIAHIHSRGIVHRDIKTENLLLKRPDCAVITDFGLATWISDERQMARRCGSVGYVAPEVCLGVPYSFKVDVFGAGVVLYFILSNEFPFHRPDRDTRDIMRSTVECNLHYNRPPWDGMSSHLRAVLRQTICRSQDDRLSALEVLAHTWVVGLPPVPSAASACVEAGTAAGGAAQALSAIPAARGPGVDAEASQTAASGARRSASLEPLQAPVANDPWRISLDGRARGLDRGSGGDVSYGNLAPGSKAYARHVDPIALAAPLPAPLPLAAGEAAAAWGYPTGLARGHWFAAPPLAAGPVAWPGARPPPPREARREERRQERCEEPREAPCEAPRENQAHTWVVGLPPVPSAASACAEAGTAAGGAAQALSAIPAPRGPGVDTEASQTAASGARRSASPEPLQMAFPAQAPFANDPWRISLDGRARGLGSKASGGDVSHGNLAPGSKAYARHVDPIALAAPLPARLPLDAGEAAAAWGYPAGLARGHWFAGPPLAAVGPVAGPGAGPPTPREARREERRQERCEEPPEAPCEAPRESQDDQLSVLEVLANTWVVGLPPVPSAASACAEAGTAAGGAAQALSAIPAARGPGVDAEASQTAASGARRSASPEPLQIALSAQAPFANDPWRISLDGRARGLGSRGSGGDVSYGNLAPGSKAYARYVDPIALAVPLPAPLPLDASEAAAA